MAWSSPVAFDLLVTFFLRILASLTLDILVLYGVDGSNAKLHLGENTEPLWLGHFSIITLELMEGISCEA